MQNNNDNNRERNALSMVGEEFLFKGHPPEMAYREALTKVDREADDPPGIRKAMIAAINYNFALNSNAYNEDSVEHYKDEYLKAVELLKKPRKRYQKMKRQFTQRGDADEGEVKELIEAEIAFLTATATDLRGRQKAEHLKKLLENWELSRHAVFSELLVRMRRSSDPDDQKLWLICSDAVLENPFYSKRVGYIDASYNAYQLSRKALEEGQMLEAHFFTVLKAAIDYNRVLHTEDFDILSEDQIEEYAAEYELLRDSLLLDKTVH